MPNIIEYNATSDITPSDKGISAAETAGRRIGQFAEQAGSDLRGIGDMVERHMAVMETSELYKTGTELKMNLQQKYATESALPENRNDPHFGDRFMAEVSPLLDQWGDGAKTDHGQELAQTLKAQIRGDIFNHVAAGQSVMDAAHVEDNSRQTMNGLASGLLLDPSEANLDRTLGTARDAIQGMTMAIPDVATREQLATELTNRYVPQLVEARYHGVAESIKNQIAETGGETSPALEQFDKDTAGQVGFQYLAPDTQASLSGVRDEAVRQGQQIYKSKVETATAQAKQEGNAAYAQIHAGMTQQMLNGEPPTPEMVADAQKFAQVYGATNPSQAAALNDFLVKGADRAQEGKVQSYNPTTRNEVQQTIGTPGGPTSDQLLQLFNHGQITREDYLHFSDVLTKVNAKDPVFTASFPQLKSRATTMAADIGRMGGPSVGIARAQFMADMTNAFMTQGKSVGYDKALETLTDPRAPYSFASKVQFYDRATHMSPEKATEYFQRYDNLDPRGPRALLPGGGAAAPKPQSGTAPAKKLTDAQVDALAGLH